MRKLNDPTATSYRVSQIAVRGGVGRKGGKFSVGREIRNFTGGIFLLGEGNLRESDFDNSNHFQS